jgi:hypothetical protein
MNEKHSSIGLRSGEYGGRYASLMPLTKFSVVAYWWSRCMDLPFLTHLLDTWYMMDPKIVNNENAARCRIWVH